MGRDRLPAPASLLADLEIVRSSSDEDDSMSEEETMAVLTILYSGTALYATATVPIMTLTV